jgi:hypothetical protein
MCFILDIADRMLVNRAKRWMLHASPDDLRCFADVLTRETPRDVDRAVIRSVFKEIGRYMSIAECKEHTPHTSRIVTRT